MDGLRMEVIERKHRVLLKDFRCQEPSLVEYLQRFALRHTEKDRLSKTHLAVDTKGESERLAGYFTLSIVSVERELVTPIESLAGLPRFPIPSVLLARLAVDQRVQKQGLGRYLLQEAFGKALALAEGSPIAVRLFATDALHETAASFYRRFGFHLISDHWPARMILDLRSLLEEKEVPSEKGAIVVSKPEP